MKKEKKFLRKNKNLEKVDLTRFRKRPFAFWFFAMKQKKWFGVMAVLCIMVASFLNFWVYLGVRNVTDNVNISGSEPYVSKLLAVFIGILIAKNVLFRLSGFFGALWITNMEMFAARTSFNYLIQHSYGYFADRLSGKLQNKIFNVSRAMDQLTGIALWSFLNLFVKLAIAFILAFITHWAMGVVMIFVVVIIALYSIWVAGKLINVSEKYSRVLSKAKGVLVDIIGNVLATKQNVALKRESYNAKKILKKYQVTHVKAWIFFDIVLFGSNSLTIILTGVIMTIVVYLWQLKVMTGGEMIMFFTMMTALYGTLEALSGNINKFLEQIGKLQEGLDEIFIPHEIKDVSNAKKVTIKKGEIAFDRVNFHYQDDEKNTVFKNLSLTIPAGQKVGLVGKSGAGKSTFVSLLLRFMDVDSGKIKIGGYDISKIRQDDLRTAIAYVPQDALLFHRSLEENIKYSNPRATKQELLQATKRAHALEFIKKFPQQFKTLVGERGVKLSGGQKQRVMIARAMLKKSPILVLDEATSALDSQAERKIQKALESLMQNRTTIAIAHRLSTLKQMDRIIVFEDGKIVEDGTHEELVEKKGKYYELWKYQS